MWTWIASDQFWFACLLLSMSLPAILCTTSYHWLHIENERRSTWLPAQNVNNLFIYLLRLQKIYLKPQALLSNQRQNSPFNLWPFVVQYGEIGKWSLVWIKVSETTNSPNTIHTICLRMLGGIKIKIFRVWRYTNLQYFRYFLQPTLQTLAAFHEIFHIINIGEKYFQQLKKLWFFTWQVLCCQYFQEVPKVIATAGLEIVLFSC